MYCHFRQTPVTLASHSARLAMDYRTLQCCAWQVGYEVESELVKAGGLLPLRLEARGSTAVTALLRTRSRHSHPDGEARRPYMLA